MWLVSGFSVPFLPTQNRDLEESGQLNHAGIGFGFVDSFGHWAGSGVQCCLPPRQVSLGMRILPCVSRVRSQHGDLGWAMPAPLHRRSLSLLSMAIATSLQHLGSSSLCVSAHTSEADGVNRPLGTKEVLDGERWKTGSSGP